jgi:Delta7-sterol 5-desaturase
VPTPWASHAFHPVDGFLQSTPYHVYAFLFPMNKARLHSFMIYNIIIYFIL